MKSNFGVCQLQGKNMVNVFGQTLSVQTCNVGFAAGIQSLILARVQFGNIQLNNAQTDHLMTAIEIITLLPVFAKILSSLQRSQCSRLQIENNHD